MDTDFSFIPERFAVQIGDRDIVLSPTQYLLFEILASVPGRVFSRAELVKLAFAAMVAERNVDVHIKELRRKLEPDDWCVATVRGQGYCFLEEPAG